MRAIAYVQLLAERSNSGVVRKLKFANMTQSVPRDPLPGAMLVRLEVEVDPSVFAIPTIHLVLDGSTEDVEAAMVPVPVLEQTDPDGFGHGSLESDDDEGFDEGFDDGGIGFDNRDHGDL